MEGAMSCPCRSPCNSGDVAQWLERWSVSPEAAGSRPVIFGCVGWGDVRDLCAMHPSTGLGSMDEITTTR